LPIFQFFLCHSGRVFSPLFWPVSPLGFWTPAWNVYLLKLTNTPFSILSPPPNKTLMYQILGGVPPPFSCPSDTFFFFPLFGGNHPIATVCPLLNFSTVSFYVFSFPLTKLFLPERAELFFFFPHSVYVKTLHLFFVSAGRPPSPFRPRFFFSEQFFRIPYVFFSRQLFSSALSGLCPPPRFFSHDILRNHLPAFSVFRSQVGPLDFSLPLFSTHFCGIWSLVVFFPFFFGIAFWT